ncbi:MULTISPECIES: gp53-like domain-containing protein [unclassified Photorhabdus]|uniref:gp53-like domain-containing protein n=1 Tax=unclassified Photorhabdus TaxID=2620880 RepID=UPI000DCB262B|nr:MULTISPECIES: phage tail protein [unclassified Photorhabdus]RAX02685.1 phage tail protein [Photorhabdus sp. S9-53]RAX02923.1 phage tail protein [Photorhabdus sp. S10-54]RAX05662.1 phage tail protein [Photorhabdus sp. S8-52]
MNPKNDFKAFSTSNNANVVSQERYEESLSLYSGFPPNDVPTHLLNKALRQSSTIASVVANFIATQSGDDVLDDGDTVKLNTQLNSALEKKFINKISDFALEKAQNGADIPDKNAFVKNLGLNEAAKREIGTGINQIPDMSYFTANLTSAGWQKLPSGLIETWGFVLANGYGSLEAGYLNNFPIPFPNACLNITLTHGGYNPQDAGICSVHVVNRSQFRCYRSPTNHVPPVGIYFRAIGY